MTTQALATATRNTIHTVLQAIKCYAVELNKLHQIVLIHTHNISKDISTNTKYHTYQRCSWKEHKNIGNTHGRPLTCSCAFSSD